MKKTQVSRMLSMILALAMMFNVFSLGTYAADITSASEATNTGYQKEVIFVDGNTIVVQTKFTDIAREAIVTINGIETYGEYNIETEKLLINGEKIETNVEDETPLISIMAWVRYNKKTGSIGTDLRDAGAVIAAIILVVNVPVGTATLVASIVVARSCDSLTYTAYEYYWDPVTTGRPKTASLVYFYADGKRIYTHDTRGNR